MSRRPTGGESDVVSRKPETDRIRLVYAAQRQQELVTPLEAIADYAAELLAWATANGLLAIRTDLERIAQAAKTLRQGLGEILLRSDEDDPVRVLAALDAARRHDLRTPLNHIVGFAELLLEDEPDAAEIHDDLGRIVGWARDVLARFDQAAQTAFVEQDEATGSGGSLADMAQDVIRAVAPMRHTRGRGEGLKGRVLVADDSELNRELLCRMLERDGHETTGVRSGRAALEALARGPYDIVLLDVMMPDMNGFEALQAMQSDARFRQIPTIMISSLDEQSIVARCLEAGAEDYVQKPPDPVIFQSRIVAVLQKKAFRDREQEYLASLDEARRRSDELLEVILPSEIVTELKAHQCVTPRRCDNVAVLFSDVVGFTKFCDSREPEEVLELLQRLVESYEARAEAHGILKIKTIGDAFMATAGLLTPLANPVRAAVEFGLDLLEVTRDLPGDWSVRVGIHVGPVVAGVLGRKQFSFDVWGDTVNTAARMESNGTPGRITLSEQAWSWISDQARSASSKIIEVKGKGPMEVFVLDSLERAR